MYARLMALLTPPRPEEDDTERLALHAFYHILLSITFITIPIIVVLIVVVERFERWGFGLALVFVVLTFWLWWLRRGPTRRALWAMSAVGLGLMALNTAAGGGVRAYAYGILVVVVLTALLLGRRAGLVFALAASVVLAALWQLERYTDWLPAYRPVAPAEAWLLHTNATFILAIAVGFAADRIRVALQRARRAETEWRALAEKHQTAEVTLRALNAFQTVVTTLSTRFINLDVTEIDAAIEDALRQIAEQSGADYARIWLLSADGSILRPAYQWHRAELTGMPALVRPEVSLQNRDWLLERLLELEIVTVPRLEALPAEAASLREVMATLQIRSAVAVPLLSGQTFTGFIALNVLREEHLWSADEVALFKTVGELIGSVLERQRRAAELVASETRFRQLVENTPVGVFMADAEGNFLYANDEYCRIVGVSRADLIGHRYNPLLPPDEQQRLDELRQRRLASEAVPARYELRFLTQDGQERWGEHCIGVIRDAAGRAIILGQLVDITERKRAEQHQLELALAQERVELLRTFIGNITHDLKTPLATITTSLYLLDYETEPERRQRTTAVIQQQVERLQSLIQNLLTISRLDYLPQLARQPTNINILVQEVRHELEPLIQRKHLRLRLDLAKPMTLVPLDGNEIKRALVNLVENAIYYTPAGGTVTVGTALDNASLTITVADTGMGIAADDLPHIFERFYRTDQARSMVRSGSGLGLAIVRRVVEMHGGQVEVESVVGQGSTFRLRLPVTLTAEKHYQI